MPTALQIGIDKPLLDSRTGVLEKAGLRVTNAPGIRDAAQQLISGPWDLAILCHTLSRQQRQKLISLIRLHGPATLILLLEDSLYSPPAPEEGIDAVLDSEPKSMIETLRRILDSRPSADSAQKRVRQVAPRPR